MPVSKMLATLITPGISGLSRIHPTPMSGHSLSKCISITARFACAQCLAGPRRSFTRVTQSPESPLAGSSVPLEAPLRSRPDPFKILSEELAGLRTDLLTLLRSGDPVLNQITEYYFLHPSKLIRPLLVLLVSQATNGLGSQWERKLWESRHEGAGGRTDELDIPITRPDVLNDWNPSIPTYTSTFRTKFSLRPSQQHRTPPPVDSPWSNASTASDAKPTRSPALHPTPIVLPTQRRLAQILEMVHTASLLHDDVVDGASLRRGSPSAPAAFGNKLSVAAGTFIVGRASAAMSRLGDLEATDLIACVLSNLVDGEILQLQKLKTLSDGQVMTKTREDAWNSYLQKTYLKTASLMAKGARAAVVLGGCKDGDIVKEFAYAYGRNLGMAFQVGQVVVSFGCC